MFSKLLVKKSALTSAKCGSAFEAIKKFMSNDVKEAVDPIDNNNSNSDEIIRKQFLRSKNTQYENGWNFLKLSLCLNQESFQYINNANGIKSLSILYFH
jgi:hypothetical protein